MRWKLARLLRLLLTDGRPYSADHAIEVALSMHDEVREDYLFAWLAGDWQACLDIEAAHS